MRVLICRSMAAMSVAMAGMGLLAVTADANLIDDTHGAGAGSFELGTFVNGGGVLPFPGADYMGVATGDATTITGWTVGGPQGIDWLIEPRFNADTGVHAIDLQHTTASSIETEIPTDVGSLYLLTFAAAAIPGHDNVGYVTAGTLEDEQFVAPFSETQDLATQTFTVVSHVFMATESSTTVTFRGTDMAGSSYQYGPVIDSVSVVLADDTDSDGDGVVDVVDNCPLRYNDDQRETDGDGIGNACDADLSNDCSVNFTDLAAFRAVFFPAPYNEHADFDGDGFVAFGDLVLIKSTFFSGPNPGPGPGAPGNDCEAP